MANALNALATDFLQGASNAAASTVSAPVDGIAWLLRKAGVPVPASPVGGSNWLAAQGLTPQPQNALAGAIGEGFGAVAPMAVAAKAPQIVNALARASENLVAPRLLGSQRGALLFVPNRTNEQQVLGVMREMKELGPPRIRAVWDGDSYKALEGSHRAEAAERLGLTPIIDEVSPRSWLTDHDIYDLPEKTSVLRALQYLYDRPEKVIDFPDL